MLADSTDLSLYHLTLQRQTNYVHSCIGHFVDYKPHQLVTNQNNTKKRKSRRDYQLCLATETHVELYDVENGDFKRLVTVPIFATITAMQSLPVDSNYSYLVLLTDSGNLSILKFVYDSGSIKLHSLLNEPFARSGIRRLSPQKHLSVDPHGRCIFLSAAERNKLCYLTDFKNKSICISSPLEVNKPNFITICTTACDVAFDNPVFASLEVDVTDKSRHLLFYMLDLGLNHVVQQSDHQLPIDANFIMPVPNLEKYGINVKASSSDGDADDQMNSFVIVGLQNKLLLKDSRGFFNLEVNLPLRENEPTPTIIIGATVHKLKKGFFMLLQANTGDLYKVKVIPNEVANSAPKITVMHFGTISPSENLHIFKNGLLVSLAELDGFALYEFDSLGDDTDESHILTSDDPQRTLNISPSTVPENLTLLERINGLNPMLSQKVVEFTPLTILGHHDGTLYNISTGVHFSELITSPLPPNPSGVWTVGLASEFGHRLVFLGLPKATMVLKIEGGSLEELEQENNKFKSENDRTIFVGAMGERSIVQVCENSMLQVDYVKRAGSITSKSEWLPPAGIKITGASCSLSQLALALSNNEIVYFELDVSNTDETLNEYQDRIEMPDKVSALAFPQAFRSDYLAVGSQDSTIKIIGLKPKDQDNFLEVLSMQVLLSPPKDIKMVHSKGLLYLHIGLDAGVYIRTNVDKVDGQLFDVRTKYLGTQPVSISVLTRVDCKPSLDEAEEEEEEEEASDKEEGEDSALDSTSVTTCAVLHCDKTWVSYDINELMLVRPLISQANAPLNAIADFRTNDIKTNGCCAVSSTGSLVIGRLDNFTTEECWFQQTKALDSTEEESEVEQFTRFRARKIITDKGDRKVQYIIENNLHDNTCRISAYRSGNLLPLDSDSSSYYKVEGCQCLDAEVARFGTNDNYLVLSTNNMVLKTYSMEIKKSNGKRLLHVNFLHDTSVEEKVHSITRFRDKLLVPLFGNVILYALGRKQLLKKSITVTPPSLTKVTCVAQWEDNRLALGDIHESVFLFLFDKRLDKFVAIADDVVKRHVTTIEFLDRSTVVGGDRFGNLWVLRLPSVHAKLIEEEYSYFLSKFHDNANSTIPRNIMECPFKWDLMNHFYANDIPVSFSVVSNMHSSDKTSILYMGLQGTIGCLLPFATKKEANFFGKLQDSLNEADEVFFLENETQRAKEEADSHDDETAGIYPRATTDYKSPRPMIEGAFSLVGREHVVYRSYYAPVKKVVDGDLCERFYHLYPSEQEFLAKKMEMKDVSSIKSRLAEVRANHL